MSSEYLVDPAQINPFLDTNSLTEQELLFKMSELDRKIKAAMNAGASYQILDQMLSMKEMFQREYSERATIKYNKDKNEFNGLIG